MFTGSRCSHSTPRECEFVNPAAGKKISPLELYLKLLAPGYRFDCDRINVRLLADSQTYAGRFPSVH